MELSAVVGWYFMAEQWIECLAQCRTRVCLLLDIQAEALISDIVMLGHWYDTALCLCSALLMSANPIKVADLHIYLNTDRLGIVSLYLQSPLRWSRWQHGWHRWRDSAWTAQAAGAGLLSRTIQEGFQEKVKPDTTAYSLIICNSVIQGWQLPHLDIGSHVTLQPLSGCSSPGLYGIITWMLL